MRSAVFFRFLSKDHRATTQRSACRRSDKIVSDSCDSVFNLRIVSPQIISSCKVATRSSSHSRIRGRKRGDGRKVRDSRMQWKQEMRTERTASEQRDASTRAYLRNFQLFWIYSSTSSCKFSRSNGPNINCFSFCK